MIKFIDKNVIIIISNKNYLTKINNYLIIDYIDKVPGTNIIFKDIKLFDKKFFFLNLKFNLKINSIILKHFYIKKKVCKKRRRKNFKKIIFTYKKKSLLFIQNIF